MPGFEIVGNEERDAILEIFEKSNGVLFRHGFDARRNNIFRVIDFQRAFARRMATGHALAVTSGTAAVKVALKALGVGPGDEVITQSFTFVATVEAILDCGATPVLTNIDDTLNMDPAELESKITERTKVIMPVHMLGVPAELDQIMAIADRHGIPVVEENCESLGGTWNGRQLGTIGKAGVYSFDFGKVITTGEGGMITSDDAELIKLAEEYHDHGHESDPALPRGRDTRRMWGFNFRMNELQAAVGTAQLAKLDFICERNRANWSAIREGLSDLPGVTLRRVPEAAEPLGDTVIFSVETAERARAFVAGMNERGLGTKNVPDAIEWHFAGYWDHVFGPLGMSDEDLAALVAPSAEKLDRSVSLPVMVMESEEDRDERIEKLREIAAQVL